MHAFSSVSGLDKVEGKLLSMGKGRQYVFSSLLPIFAWEQLWNSCMPVSRYISSPVQGQEGLECLFSEEPVLFEEGE